MASPVNRPWWSKLWPSAWSLPGLGRQEQQERHSIHAASPQPGSASSSRTSTPRPSSPSTAARRRLPAFESMVEPPTALVPKIVFPTEDAPPQTTAPAGAAKAAALRDKGTAQQASTVASPARTASITAFRGYAVIDVQTTGPDPHRHRVVEIAVALLDEDGRLEDEWFTLIDPQGPVGPTSTHGITDGDVVGAPTFATMAPHVLAALDGRVLVAHNARIQALFLQHELTRLGVDFPSGTPHGVCTMTWAPAHLEAPSRRLVDCCGSADVPLLVHHSARTQARAAAGLLRCYLERSGGTPRWAAHLGSNRYIWPKVAAVYGPMPRRERARSIPAIRPTGVWSDQLLSGLTQVGDASVDAYLDIIDRALIDPQQVVTADALAVIAEDLEIAGDRVDQIHRDHLADLTRIAATIGQVTREERRDLERLATMMGLTAADVKSALYLSSHDVPRHGGPGGDIAVTLSAGDRVSFTGSLSRGRGIWQQRVREAGLTTGGVTQDTKVVVAAGHGSTETLTKARTHRIPTLGEDEFETLFAAYQRERDVPQDRNAP
ncbi:3'-5' exonuclease DinG [Austwickia sp. TVS 96-490-7B]|uniref:exonuclease domain-containing protein n=1 Tax=Austwickia sp. TVS 96-490-7B TaxID=2830843 RepID=UPI001C57AA0A|nr:exonuclease domain-containing protein [Austwickia sp. TVS 96-490-7B]MBW3084263.1 3'-5' exonuclease DinG [Austwickia sp. TVS 96-490-7B]